MDSVSDNRQECQRRARSISTLAEITVAASWATSSLLPKGEQATQRSMKFTRWPRLSVRDLCAEEVAVIDLLLIYGTLSLGKSDTSTHDGKPTSARLPRVRRWKDWLILEGAFEN